MPTPPFSRNGLRRRSLLAGASALLAAGCAPADLAPRRPAPAWGEAPPPWGPLRLLDEITIAHRLEFRGTTVGGLSAIDYEPATGLYDLLSDDRSDLQPARLYRARIAFDGRRFGPLDLVDVVTLRQPDGSPLPNRQAAPAGIAVPDPEALRRLPGGNLLWASEGDVRRGFGPALYEARPDGTQLRAFELPAHFAPGDGRGARDNLAFEGLAVAPDGKSAWAAMENALAQDGPVPRVGAPGGPCRFTLFELASGRAVRQIAYRPDAISGPPAAPGGFADNGVSEILALDAAQLLVLERAYMQGVGNSLRLYRVDTREAGDTLALDTLTPANHQPVPKTLLADFSQLGLARLDNTEGLCWGPVLADGRRSLLAVSDDNFNSSQTTQIAAFAFSG